MWTNSTDDELDWEMRSGLHHECSEYSPVDDIVEITKQTNSETLIKQKQNRRVLTGAAPLCVMQKHTYACCCSLHGPGNVIKNSLSFCFSFSLSFPYY